MNKYTRFHLVDQCLLVVMALVLTSSSSEGQARRLRSSFNTLTLTLSIPDRSFVLLEPVPLTLTLENRSGRNVLGHTALDFGFRRVRVQIQPEGSDPYVVDQLSTTAGLFHISPRAIKPGEKHQNTQPLMVGLDTLLPNPGRYDIQVMLRGIEPGDEISSNIVSIQVRAPEANEQEAYEYLQRTGRAAHFLTGVVQDDLEIRQLDEFASFFGDTPYGDYAVYFLGVIHAARREDDKARSFLVRVATKKEFALAARAATYLGQIQARKK